MQRLARFLSRRRRRGEIAIEWILLATILGIGVIGGLGTARNAIIVELKDIADAVSALDFFP
jgi:pilus assembly protein Flp/PilA